MTTMRDRTENENPTQQEYFYKVCNENMHTSVFSDTDMSRLMTKPTKWSERPAKTQISLGVRPVWSESSQCAKWVAKDPNFLHADAQADLSLRWAHMPFRWFCHEMAHIVMLKIIYSEFHLQARKSHVLVPTYFSLASKRGHFQNTCINDSVTDSPGCTWLSVLDFDIQFEWFTLVCFEYRVKKCEYRVVKVEYRVRKGEFRVVNIAYRVRKGENRVVKVEHRVKKCEFRVKKSEYRVVYIAYRVRKGEYRVKKSEKNLSNRPDVKFYRRNIFFAFLHCALQWKQI